MRCMYGIAALLSRVEWWYRSFCRMLKRLGGVGRPGPPVGTGPCAARTPLLKSVTFWVPIDTTICRGPFGIWPKPASFLGSALSFLVGATLALRAGLAAAGGAYQPSYQP